MSFKNLHNIFIYMNSNNLMHLLLLKNFSSNSPPPPFAVSNPLGNSLNNLSNGQGIPGGVLPVHLTLTRMELLRITQIFYF